MAEYVKNKDFLKLLQKFKKTKDKKVYNEIGKCFLLIATNLLNKPKFINYTPDRKGEMISDAVFYMCRYVDKFDTERTNPFAYFTTVARNAFLQNINDYSKRDSMFTSIEYIENVDQIDGL